MLRRIGELDERHDPKATLAELHELPRRIRLDDDTNLGLILEAAIILEVQVAVCRRRTAE